MMNVYKSVPNLEIECIDDGYVCLLDNKVCFLNQSAYEILAICDGKDLDEIIKNLFENSSFSDESVDAATKTKDILDALETLVINGLVEKV